MAYATIQDMIARFGEIEMIRLSVPDGGDLTQIDSDAVDRALANASARMDTYLRRRYQTPVTAVPVPPELNDAAISIARYMLSFGGQKEPSEQTRLQYKDAIAWLAGVNEGRILLADLTPSGDQSFAQVSTRRATFQDDGDPTGSNSGCRSQIGGVW